MPKIPRKRLLKRQHDRRSAKIIIVATEGRETEKQYFSMFRSEKLHIEVLPTGEDNKSAPKYVAKRLDEFKEKYDIQGDDELWLVLDVDSWSDLHDVCQEGRQKGYQLAVSNPCFEAWLVLHFQDLNEADKTCKDFEQRLKRILGGYKKGNLEKHLSKYKPKVQAAIRRAEQSHDSKHYWPPHKGSYVHRLVKTILQYVDFPA